MSINHKLEQFAQEGLSRILNNPDLMDLDKLPKIPGVKMFLSMLLQKLPEFLSQWIREQDPTALRNKVIWIREVVIPWLLSDETTSQSNQTNEPRS